MISIKTFNGGIFQTIHVTEDDTTYNDLLKYIKIPPHPRFKNYDQNIFSTSITVKTYINFDSELTIGFYFEYYVNQRKFGDDFNLSDTSTHDKCKTLIENCPFNIIFISDKMLTEELCKLAVRQNVIALQFVKEQTEELCKLAVRQNGYALRHVANQTEEICKLAVRQTGMSLRYVKKETLEICKLAVQQNSLALFWIK